MGEWEKVKKSDEDRIVEELVSFVDRLDGCGLMITDPGMVATSVAALVWAGWPDLVLQVIDNEEVK